jgi:hypothetical protein
VDWFLVTRAAMDEQTVGGVDLSVREPIRWT